MSRSRNERVSRSRETEKKTTLEMENFIFKMAKPSAAPKSNAALMLNNRELDKLSEIYDYFDDNGDGTLVS